MRLPATRMWRGLAIALVALAALPSAAAAQSYSERTQARASLLSYWRLGETAGTVAKDARGGRNGTYVNGVALGQPGALTADPDKAPGFDGVNDTVSLPTLPSSANFTISGWQRIDAGAPNNNPLYAGIGSVRFMPRPGGFYVGVWLGGAEQVLQGVTPANTGAWVHWAMVRSGSSLTVYRNGVAVGSRAVSATALASLSGAIGRYATAYAARAGIDDVAVYSQALSATEIKGDYESRGVAPDPTDPDPTDPDPGDPPAPVDPGPTAPRYVDGGSRGGPCSDSRGAVEAADPATPWCTIGRAAVAAPAAGTVLVRAGEYARTTITGEARPETLTVKPYGTEQPVLRGLTVTRSSGYSFEGFRIIDATVLDGSTDIALRKNDISPHDVRVPSGARLTFEDNYIHDLTIPGGRCGDAVRCGYGIRISAATDVTIRGNRFVRIPADGIQMGANENVLIEDNEFADISPFIDPNEHSDAIQFYSSSRNATIRGNWIHGTIRGPILAGTTVGQAQTGLTIENNLIVPDKDWGLNLFNAPGAKVVNNTVWGAGNTESLIFRDIDGVAPTRDAQVFNNILYRFTADPAMFALEDYNLVVNGLRGGTHDIAGPPRFADQPSGDFRLVGGSPGIDAGLSTGAPDRDRTGQTRVDTPAIPNTGGGAAPHYDIGAYEFSGAYAPPGGSYSSRILGVSSLLGYWRLGESAGAVADDSKGSRDGSFQNGVVLGEPGALAGDANTAVRLDGVNDGVSLPAGPSSVDFTVEGWQRIDAGAASNNTLYGQSGAVRLMPRPNGYYVGVWLGGAEQVLQGVTAANTGNWVHWAVARAGGTLTVYRNGHAVGQRAVSATATANLSGSIGRAATIYPTKGAIDEVAVYGSALSGAELLTHHDLGRPAN